MAADARFEPRGVPGRRDGKVMMETYGTSDAFLETLAAIGARLELGDQREHHRILDVVADPQATAEHALTKRPGPLGDPLAREVFDRSEDLDPPEGHLAQTERAHQPSGPGGVATARHIGSDPISEVRPSVQSVDRVESDTSDDLARLHRTDDELKLQPVGERAPGASDPLRGFDFAVLGMHP